MTTVTTSDICIAHPLGYYSNILQQQLTLTEGLLFARCCDKYINHLLLFSQKPYAMCTIIKIPML